MRSHRAVSPRPAKVGLTPSRSASVASDPVRAHVSLKARDCGAAARAVRARAAERIFTLLQRRTGRCAAEGHGPICRAREPPIATRKRRVAWRGAVLRLPTRSGAALGGGRVAYGVRRAAAIGIGSRCVRITGLPGRLAALACTHVVARTCALAACSVSRKVRIAGESRLYAKRRRPRLARYSERSAREWAPFKPTHRQRRAHCAIRGRCRCVTPRRAACVGALTEAVGISEARSPRRTLRGVRAAPLNAARARRAGRAIEVGGIRVRRVRDGRRALLACVREDRRGVAVRQRCGLAAPEKHKSQPSRRSPEAKTHHERVSCHVVRSIQAQARFALDYRASPRCS